MLKVMSKIKTLGSAIRSSGVRGLAECFGNFLERGGYHGLSRLWRQRLIDCRWLVFRMLKPYRKIVFLTFADGVFYTSDRLIAQARNTRIFSAIIPEDQTTLGSQFDHEFSRHLRHSRGFGYWSWKPFIIKRTMDSLSLGDVIIYADSGCSLVNPTVILKDVILELLNSGLNVAVSDLWNDQRIKQWTKRDLIEAMGISVDSGVVELPQYEAGRLALVVSVETLSFVGQWLDIARDIHLIDDSPSSLPEHRDFIEHRHDQSIFAILLHRLTFLKCLGNAILATRLKK